MTEVLLRCGPVGTGREVQGGTGMQQQQAPGSGPAESPYLAQHWFMRLRAPDCTEHDRAAFARWEQLSPNHAKAYADFVAQWAEQEWEVHRSEGAKYTEPENGRDDKPARRRTGRRFAWQGAATLALALLKG